MATIKQVVAMGTHRFITSFMKGYFKVTTLIAHDQDKNKFIVSGTDGKEIGEFDTIQEANDALLKVEGTSTAMPSLIESVKEGGVFIADPNAVVEAPECIHHWKRGVLPPLERIKTCTICGIMERKISGEEWSVLL